MHKHKTKNFNVAKESYLIFDSVDIKQLLNPAPGERSKKVISPVESATEFNQELNQAAEAQMQHPLGETISDLKEGATNTINEISGETKSTVSNIVKSAVTIPAEGLGWVAKLPFKIGRLIAKGFTHAVTAPIAFVSNGIQHLWNLGVSVPVSGALVSVNTVGKYIGAPSTLARKARDKGLETIDNVVNSIQEGINNRVSNIINAVPQPA